MKEVRKVFLGRRLQILVLAIALVIIASACTLFDPPPPADRPGPEGIWRAPSHGSFRFDGHSVTLTLVPRWSWEWRPLDCCWKLESRWSGDDLYVRGPYGNWWKVATFKEGRFRADDGSSFEKVSWGSLTESDWRLLRRRLAYDCSRGPSQRGSPGWLKRVGNWLHQ